MVEIWTSVLYLAGSCFLIQPIVMYDFSDVLGLFPFKVTIEGDFSVSCKFGGGLSCSILQPSA